METDLSVTDFRGQKQGSLAVKVSPCYQDGTLPTETQDDLFVEDPNDLVSFVSYTYYNNYYNYIKQDWQSSKLPAVYH